MSSTVSLRHALLAGAAAVMLAGPAAAADRAAEIGAAIDAYLAEMASGPDSGVTIDGKTKVTGDGNRFNAELPTLRLGEAGEGLILAGIKLELEPQGQDMRFRAMLPEAFPIGTKGERIAVGRHDIAGVWNTSIRNFPQLDAAIDSLTAQDDKGNALLSIGRTAINAKLVEDAQKRWSGYSRLSLADLGFIAPDGTGGFSLGRLAAETSIDKADMVKAAALQERATAMQAQAEKEPEAALKAASDMLGSIAGLFSGGATRLEAEKIAFQSKEQGLDFGFDRLALDMGLNGFDSSNASLSTGYGHSGLTINPQPPFAEFIPGQAAYKISIAKVPSDKLWKSFADYITNSATAGEEQANAQLMGEMMMAMAAAKSEFRLDALSFAAPETGGEGSGSAAFDAESAMGVSGGFLFKLRGLDRAIAKAVEMGKKDPEAKEMAGVLSMVSTMGQAGKDTDGRDIRTYKIDIAQDGRLLLNGNDLTPLLGMGGGETATDDDMPAEEGTEGEEPVAQ
ncbi:MAG TPA: hypothetical protein VEH84_08620 [Alphaproteobacteria bacterium]|nr:hypothetical protein [Alphaproteobacteria bacterium]